MRCAFAVCFCGVLSLGAPARSCSKSFGESTPSREAYRAHSSPNSPILPRLVKPPPLEGPARHIAHQTIWLNSIPHPLWPFRVVCVAIPDLVSPLPDPVSSFPVFPTCNVRKKNGLSRTFSSGRVTLGNCQCALQRPLWPIPVFRTCNVRMKISLPRTFSSGRVTLGNSQPPFQGFLGHFTVTVCRFGFS